MTVDDDMVECHAERVATFALSDSFAQCKKPAGAETRSEGGSAGTAQWALLPSIDGLDCVGVSSTRIVARQADRVANQ